MTTERRRLEFRRLADVEMRSIVYLDRPLLQRAAFELVVGRKGAGKGTWLAGLAARASRGDLLEHPVDVLIVATEDSDEIDVKPRVIAAGGDPERIHTLVTDMRLPHDVPALRAAALEIGDVGLIILDPIASLVRGDTHAENPVRNAIDPLNGLASTATEEVFKSKNAHGSNLYLQVRGSSGVVAVVEHHLLRSRALGGFTVAPKAQGQRDCTVTREIGRRGPPLLRKYAGEKLTVSVYGDSRFAPTACQNFGKGLSGAQKAKVGSGVS